MRTALGCLLPGLAALLAAGCGDAASPYRSIVREQIAAARPATAVIGGGVGPENAREQLERAGTRDGVMLLLGSAAYAHPGGARAGVAAAVDAIG